MQATIYLHATHWIPLLIQLRKKHQMPYLMPNSGESGIDTGVPGNINDGDPLRSNECECDNDGVWFEFH